jgi:hypothetical protein
MPFKQELPELARLERTGLRSLADGTAVERVGSGGAVADRQEAGFMPDALQAGRRRAARRTMDMQPFSY